MTAGLLHSPSRSRTESPRRASGDRVSPMAFLRGTVLFAAGLFILASALPGELRGQRSPVSGTEYGVKLCGREFIRAVIFTCGGSRWKRIPEEEQRESGFVRRGEQSAKFYQLAARAA